MAQLAPAKQIQVGFVRRCRFCLVLTLLSMVALAGLWHELVVLTWPDFGGEQLLSPQPSADAEELRWLEAAEPLPYDSVAERSCVDAMWLELMGNAHIDRSELTVPPAMRHHRCPLNDSVAERNSRATGDSVAERNCIDAMWWEFMGKAPLDRSKRTLRERGCALRNGRWQADGRTKWTDGQRTLLVRTGVTREMALQQLMSSLLRVDYGGDQVHLQVEVDLSVYDRDAQVDVNVSSWLATIEWPYGDKSLNAGSGDGWIKNVLPRLRSTRDILVILEDDVVVSPVFWLWLRFSQAAFQFRDDVSGVSLQRPAFRALGGASLQQIGPVDRPFMLRLFSGLGFAPSASRWRDFVAWSSARGGSERSNSVEGGGQLPEDCDMGGERGQTWKQRFAQFSSDRQLYTVYQTPARGAFLAAPRACSSGSSGAAATFADVTILDVVAGRAPLKYDALGLQVAGSEPLLPVAALPAPPGPGVAQAMRRPRSARVAVLLAGLAKRLLLQPTLAHVIAPNHKSGIRVDLFGFLGDEEPQFWDRRDHDLRGEPWLQGLGRDAFAEQICARAYSAGAFLCDVEVGPSKTVDLPKDCAHRNLVASYNPVNPVCTRHQQAVGMRLLQRWAALERCWARARQSEKQQGAKYSQVLVLRDDTFWFQPFKFNYREFLGEKTMTVKVMGCMSMGGVNDKILYLGRGAAKQLLQPLHAWFYDQRSELIGTYNAEEFLLELGRRRGVAFKRTKDFHMVLGAFKQDGAPCFRKTSDRWVESCYKNLNVDLLELLRQGHCSLPAEAGVGKLWSALSGEPRMTPRRPLRKPRPRPPPRGPPPAGCVAACWPFCKPACLSHLGDRSDICCFAGAGKKKKR